MRILVLDNDAVAHGRGLELQPLLESVMAALGARSCVVEKFTYVEMQRTGLGLIVDGWQREQLLADPVDYRKLGGGDKLFRELERQWGRRGLSKADRASLVVAASLRPSAILTCESLLSEAARAYGVLPLDLFDLVRFGLQLGTVTQARAVELCLPWTDKYRAGRPLNYAGSFEAERIARDANKPLPTLKAG